MNRQKDERRITLVTPRTPARTWNATRESPSRIVVARSFAILRYALLAGIEEHAYDIERVIVDAPAKAEDYLDLLADLPHAFRGDVVYVREDGSAFLSSAGRCDDRTLYALTDADLRFYFDVNGLVPAGRDAAA